MELYDNFPGSAPDDAKWQVATVPLGSDEFWYYRDDNARISCNNSLCTIEIPEFSKQHNQVQMFDNPKHLMLATRSWETSNGPISFSTTIGASISGDPNDYRDGFAAFNVLDFASAMVFDIISSSQTLSAFNNRLVSKVFPFLCVNFFLVPCSTDNKKHHLCLSCRTVLILSSFSGLSRFLT